MNLKKKKKSAVGANAALLPSVMVRLSLADFQNMRSCQGTYRVHTPLLCSRQRSYVMSSGAILHNGGAILYPSLPLLISTADLLPNRDFVPADLHSFLAGSEI